MEFYLLLPWQIDKFRIKYFFFAEDDQSISSGLGCWEKAHLDVSDTTRFPNSNSHEVCSSFCRKEANLGAALSAGHCYCLSALPEDDKQAEGHRCSKRCPGDPQREWCGKFKDGMTTVLSLEQDRQGMHFQECLKKNCTQRLWLCYKVCLAKKVKYPRGAFRRSRSLS